MGAGSVTARGKAGVRSPIANAATDALTVIFGFLDDSNRAIAKTVCRRWRPLCAPKAAAPLHLWQFGDSVPRLEWALANGCSPTAKKFRIVGLRAINIGNQPVAQFAYTRARASGANFRAIEAFCIHAATHDRLPLLQWLLANSAPMSNLVAQAASSVEMLEWIKRNSTPRVWVGLVARFIIENKPFAVMKWHAENGSLRSELCQQDYIGAARSGSVEKLDWMFRTDGRPATAGFIGQLARRVAEGLSSSTACLDYLRDVRGYRAAGCPHAATACHAAAAHGKLAILKWLHREGAEWRADAYLTTVLVWQDKCQRAIARFADKGSAYRARCRRLEKLRRVGDWITTASRPAARQAARN
jgi:hypothetical protein